MDALTSLLWILVLFGTVGLTLSVNVNRKLRQFDKRLATLESKTIDTELSFEDVVRDIASLSETRCDIHQSPSPDTKLNNPVSVQAESSVQHIINRFKLGMKEEKMARKLATENMKAELYEVGNGLKRSAHMELLKVNKTLQTVLDVSSDFVSEINEKLEMLPSIVRRNITTTFETKQDAGTKSLTLAQQFEESLSEIRKDVHTLRNEIRNDVTTTFQQIRDLTDNNSAWIHAIAEHIHTHDENTLRLMSIMFNWGEENLHHWRGHTYGVFEDKAIFELAVTVCGAASAHLVDINSDDEMSYITSILKDSYWYWIGLNDRTVEGQWQWHHNNQKPVYSRVGQSQPDNSGNENCIVTRKSGEWKGVPCIDDKYGFVCKYSKTID